MSTDSDAERLIVLVEARVNELEKNMRKAAGTTEQSYNRMQRGSRSATRQMEQDMARSTARIKQAVASTSTQIGALGRTFAGAFAGGMFVGGLAGLQRGASELVAEMSKIADTAKVIGTSAEDLQRLRYGFDTVGVSVSDVDTGMRRFARRIGEAANGGGVLHDVLKANNVQLRNADGSMRSQMDLLRDYADLIKNAGSHQERLALAFKAFDVGGAAMVQALENGADGLDTLMGKVDEAGGVIDEELVQRAAELDQRWSDSWRRFEVNAKNAVLTAVTWLDDFISKADEVANHSIFRKAAEWLPTWGGADITYLDPDLARAKGQELGPDARIRDAFSHALTDADEALVAELQKRYGVAAEKAQTTIIPGGKDDDGTKKRSGSRNQAAEAALREAEAVRQLIDNLSHELSLVGQSDVEKAKANALRQAGAAATDEQRRQIEMLVQAIHEETEAHKLAEQAAAARSQAFENLFGMATDGILSIMDGSVKAEDAVKKLAVQLALAVAQAALLGTGPLAGLFGGGGGLLGALFKADGGIIKKADGGVIRGPGTGTSDSIPAWLSDGEFIVNAKATKKHRGLLEQINADDLPAFARGGGVGALARSPAVAAGTPAGFGEVLS